VSIKIIEIKHVRETDGEAVETIYIVQKGKEGSLEYLTRGCIFEDGKYLYNFTNKDYELWPFGSIQEAEDALRSWAKRQTREEKKTVKSFENFSELI